jgi:NDP-sugar pyrophosphorylase family protein
MTHPDHADDLTLVVMAAGLGSRFGGTKQLAEVGPRGEAFLDFAIDDAVAAGVTRVVLVVRTDIEADVRAHLAKRERRVPIEFVRQDELGPSRPKPWGTAHAILSTAPLVTGPFIVVNADDYYGASSYVTLAEAMSDMPSNRIYLVAFELGRTLPASGTVSRGVCATDKGRLVELDETHLLGGTAEGITLGGEPSDLTADTPVSMNMFGMPASFLAELPARWSDWFGQHGTGEKTEFLLPTVIAELMGEGRFHVQVVSTGEDWIGVTNPDDLAVAREVLHAKRG